MAPKLDMSTIFRIEDKNGNGPHKAGGSTFSLAEELGEAHSDSQHPCAIEMRGWRYGMIFGFDCLDKLFNWFDGWLDELIDEGFDIVEYKVEDFVTDGKQVAFFKEKQ